MMISTNYKDIVNEFDKIQEVTINKNKITVFGIINEKEAVFEYFYKHNKVAKEVHKKVSYFKNL